MLLKLKLITLIYYGTTFKVYKDNIVIMIDKIGLGLA